MHPSAAWTLLLAQTAFSQKTQVDSALLATFERYAAFASASYSSDCDDPPFGSVAEKYINDVATSTQATLFRDDAAQEYVVSFRGTSDVQDFVTDLDQKLVSCVAPGLQCLGCTCAQGYLRQYNAVAAEVKSAIDSGIGKHPGYSLVITGHSMGGALASLGAASLHGQGLSLVTYTYGQPRTGDQTYADFIDAMFNGTMYRLTHKNDGVPQIPPQSDGYRHHSTEYWQSDDPPTTANTFRCQGQEPSDCNQSEIGFGIGNGGRGINLAHLSYFGVSIGNPLNPNAAC
ncbi:hypothetical protein JX266_013332 [Neoarthrinium moseri]|uniref:uncharacterized protein n=1 Tax=Neoarthrinium moseri TaxID=1658444 RepID=UPI001FDC6A80|nr:uncharacterized protein JN550_009777 [Neoarthrinium moseri]KAI1840448.1 hypothetical protein JX266_013332 [Neoarthrinium moseri]KAI1863251.1 hypothetical protein JN550_009777 [Neoarthrinium moseri]